MSQLHTLDPEQTGRWSVTTDDATYHIELNRRGSTITVDHSTGTYSYDLRFLLRCHVGEPMTFVVHDEDPSSDLCHMQCSYPVRAIRSA